jgi:hypothetical protein
MLAAGLAMMLAEQVDAANLAPLGDGILGVNDAIDADAGTPRYSAGVLNTRVDNWYGGNAEVYSYVGVLWLRTRYDQIQSLSLTLATFSDGGWFGVSGFSPEPGTTLLSFDLIEPVVQVTTDGGITWTTVDHHSNYLTVMDGHTIGGGTRFYQVTSE